MKLDQLPVDVILHVISYLPLKTLAGLSSLSKSWARLMRSNESSIYHYACVRYGFASSIDASLEDTKKASCIGCNVGGWKPWCVRRFQLESAWLGDGPSVRKSYNGRYGNVHRIKVDEKAGYMITTFSGGGLVVASINDNQTLWSLPSTYVRSHAHCEYENGFIIFDRGNQQNEVWRRVVDCNSDNSPTVSLPDDSQHFEYTRAENLYSSTQKIGHFQPWALLNMPQFGRAFRLVYPTLLIASIDKAYLWNIVTAEIEQIITIIAPDEMEDVFSTVGQLSYVDVDARYVFICSTHSLRVFDRTNGAMVWALAAGHQAFDYYSNSRLQVQWEEGGMYSAAANPLSFKSNSYSPSHLREDFFYAVHVSPCGRHIAILFSYNRLLIIRDFQRLLVHHSSHTGAPIPSLKDTSTEIHFTNPSDGLECSSYFTFRPNRISLVCTSGLFVIHLDSPLVMQGDLQHESSSPIWPNLRVCSINGFNGTRRLEDVSCLQLAETGLFIAYGGERRDQERKKVWHVDFDPDHREASEMCSVFT